MKKSFPQKFKELRSLAYLGFPHSYRLPIWEKILGVDQIIEITLDKIKEPFPEVYNELSESGYEDKKKGLFDSFIKQIKIQFKPQFSLIDNDMNFLNLENIHYPTNDLSYGNNLKSSIRSIAKAFFIWSSFNIHINSDPKDSENKKFVYFFGLLHIILKFSTVFKEDHQTFWIIVGLSQHLQNFYEANPLYNNQSSNISNYTLISKVFLINSVYLRMQSEFCLS